MKFSSTISNGVARVTFHHGAFMIGAHIDEKHEFLHALKNLEQDEEVRAVLLFNDDEAFTAKEHAAYVESLKKSAVQNHQEAARHVLELEENAFIQFHRLAARYDKILVSCLSGQISTPIFGLSLATDLRLADRDMSYSLSHVQLGLPPVGGLGYLLPRFVGESRSRELLLLGGDIDAATALDYGLVNGIIESNNFAESCEIWITERVHGGTSHIKSTRALLNHGAKDFDHYMQRELLIRRSVLP